jgi:hypothetical protein
MNFKPLVIWIWNQNIAISTIVGTSSHIIVLLRDVFHIEYDQNQFNTNIFCIGTIPVSPITARSESSRRFDNRKEKSREILDWLINKGIIT